MANDYSNITLEVSEGNGAVSFDVSDLISISGASPYIGDNGTWMVYNDKTKEYVDTGIVAEGKGIVSVLKTSSSGLVDTYTITFSDDTTTTYTITNGEDGTSGKSPYINSENNHWMAYDDENQQWVDTGVDAGGSGSGEIVKDGHSPYIGQNGHWYVFNDSTQQWSDTNVTAQGTDGVSPTMSVSQITGGHRVTITDKDHPSGMQFDVTDGADGTDASLPTGSSTNDILVWDGTWTPTDFSAFVTDRIGARQYLFTGTGMTDGSTITSVDYAITIGLSAYSGLEHQYLIQTGQDSAISLQPYTLATDQNGIHLGLYTIIDGALYYTLLTAAAANVVFTGTLHVVDLTTKELPTVSSSDSGKFLRVSSQGTWIADTVPSAEGSGF